MTTAHRPTWNAAVAGSNNNSGNLMVAQTTKVANRDAASFLSIKTRQVGQGLPEERGSKRDLREELERKEREAAEERKGGPKKPKVDEKKKIEDDNPFPEDADEIGGGSESEKSDKEDDDDDDDEDTEELMRELAKIKKEREAEEAAAAAVKQKSDDRARRDEVMKGNPLLQTGDFSLKRKWDDDTVFQNQARTAPKQKERFINDAVRSDFHRKFLNKYVWVDGTAH